MTELLTYDSGAATDHFRLGQNWDPLAIIDGFHLVMNDSGGGSDIAYVKGRMYAEMSGGSSDTFMVPTVRVDFQSVGVESVDGHTHSTNDIVAGTITGALIRTDSDTEAHIEIKNAVNEMTSTTYGVMSFYDDEGARAGSVGLWNGSVNIHTAVVPLSIATDGDGADIIISAAQNTVVTGPMQVDGSLTFDRSAAATEGGSFKMRARSYDETIDTAPLPMRLHQSSGGGYHFEAYYSGGWHPLNLG